MVFINVVGAFGATNWLISYFTSKLAILEAQINSPFEVVASSYSDQEQIYENQMEIKFFAGQPIEYQNVIP